MLFNYTILTVEFIQNWIICGHAQDRLVGNSEWNGHDLSEDIIPDRAMKILKKKHDQGVSSVRNTVPPNKCKT
jgi:hypothetical protein